jgi:CMP-N,N'-diacetyllegionaminic acid synthase
MKNNNKTVAIVLARGGSKGIPSKNIVDFCGKPLLAWTINQCNNSTLVDEVWVSSDSEEILKIAESFNCKTLMRPEEYSTDIASSEEAWKHALDFIEDNFYEVDLVVAPQVTSPLRQSSDIDRAIEAFYNGNFDSMFSACVAGDLFFWKENAEGMLEANNYDYKNRQRRQDIEPIYIENGSFYLFSPNSLNRYKNRFGNKIGKYVMESWKMFEIDNYDDLKVCSALMKEFLLEKEPKN